MREVFLAYAKEDSTVVQRLMVHLRGWKYAGRIEVWYDGNLALGEKWDPKIRRQLAAADVIIFCVSADLLANRYVQEVEIPAAIARHHSDEAILIPVILRPCAWQDHVLGEFQAFPAKGRTIDDYIKDGKVEDAWTEVTKGVKKAVASFEERHHMSSSTERRSGLKRPPSRQTWGKNDLRPATNDVVSAAERQESQDTRLPNFDFVNIYMYADPRDADVDVLRYGFQCQCAVSVLMTGSKINHEGGGTFELTKKAQDYLDERDIEDMARRVADLMSASGSAAKLAQQWLYEGHTFNVRLPGSKAWLPSHPGLLLRLAGIWKGWNDFLGLEKRTNPKEYQENEDTDSLEARAFDIYGEAASSIYAIVKAGQKGRGWSDLEMFEFLHRIAIDWASVIRDWEADPTEDG